MAASRSLLLLSLSLLLLNACGEVRENLGLGRNPPDEFAVLERPPLSMPPDYSLHPPRPGEARPQSVDTAKIASETLFNGNAPAAADTMSEAEKNLLVSTGANRADPNIRDTVDRETSEKVVASPHLVDRLTHWSDNEKPATTVDATAEAARIKDAQQQNQSVTTGATPVIEKQNSGWLGL